MSLAGKSDTKDPGQEEYGWLGQSKAGVTQLILNDGRTLAGKTPEKLEVSTVPTEGLLNSIATSSPNTGGGMQTIKIEQHDDHDPVILSEEYILINSGIAQKNPGLSTPPAVNPTTIAVSGPINELPKATPTGTSSENCSLSEQMLLQVVDRFVKGSAQELSVAQPVAEAPQPIQLDNVTIAPMEESAVGNNTITVIADGGNTPHEVLLLEVENLNGAVTEVGDAKAGTSQIHQVSVMNDLISSQMLDAAIYAIPEQMLSGDDILHGAINQAGIAHQNQLLSQQGLLRAVASLQPAPNTAPTRTRTVNGRPTHPCQLCDKSFLHRRSLKRHYKSHTGDPPREGRMMTEEERKRCEQCGKTFSQVSSLNRHKRHNHEIYPSENGEGQSTDGGVVMNAGDGGSKAHKCMVCDKSFKHAASLERHFSLHTTEGKPYKCQHCDKAFRQLRSLKKHSTLHAGKGKQCPHCWMSFRQRRDLKKHLRTHKGDRIHQCKYCEKAFPEWGLLKAHKQVHAGDKPYHCLYCDRAFSKKSRLARHHETHLTAMAPTQPPQYMVDVSHSADGTEETTIVLTEQQPPQQGQTDRLSDRESAVFPAEASSSSGTSQVIGYSITPETGGETPRPRMGSTKKSKSGRKSKKRYRCRGCKKKIRNLGMLRLHESECATSMPHRCDLCGKRFTRMNNLKIHQRVHTGIKPFQCQYCQKTFSQGGTLKRHEKIHSDEKIHHCKYCNEAFKWRSHLQEHEKVHVADATAVYCKYCGAAYMNLTDLRAHERVHGNQSLEDPEKPHRCIYCGKVFRQASELTSHLRVHTGERPFQCKQCPKAFKYRSNLYEHEFLHKRGYTKRSKGLRKQETSRDEIAMSVGPLEQYVIPEFS